jgi:hypothetical protein
MIDSTEYDSISSFLVFLSIAYFGCSNSIKQIDDDDDDDDGRRRCQSLDWLIPEKITDGKYEFILESETVNKGVYFPKRCREIIWLMGIPIRIRNE